MPDADIQPLWNSWRWNASVLDGDVGKVGLAVPCQPGGIFRIANGGQGTARPT